ncbi:MAG: BACON domain-containing protein [Alistipes sp.]|nr:BACON domain-containing protein [Alistipes sp.]
MRLKHLFMLLAMAAIMVACSEKADEPNSGLTPEIILSQEPIWLDSEEGIYELEYTIKNPSASLKLDAKSNVDWASIIEVRDEVVSFVVTKNSEPSDRRGTIYLTYGQAKAEVKIYQHVKVDVDFEAKTTQGSIFTHCNNEAGVHSYRVVLSKEGVNDDGSFKHGAKYYCFDLCAKEVVSKEDTEATIPDGRYTLSMTGELSDRAINYMYSYYVIGDNYYQEEVAFAGAEVVVESGKIVANASLANGENHRIEYNGSLVIPVYNASVTGGLSTLTDNHTFDIEDGVFVGAFVGDLMYNGCNTCQVYLYEYLDYNTGEERGDQFQIDFQLPAGSRDIVGTYTHGTTAGHFIPGSAEDLGGQYMQQNSWYMTAGYIDFAPLVRGSVKVEKQSESVYIFTIDTVDDMGNSIRGTFKGSGEFIDW